MTELALKMSVGLDWLDSSVYSDQLYHFSNLKNLQWFRLTISESIISFLKWVVNTDVILKKVNSTNFKILQFHSVQLVLQSCYFSGNTRT